MNQQTIDQIASVVCIVSIDFLENAPAKIIELCSAVREQDERISELEQDAESCAEYEADALRRIGEEVIAGRQHEARGELPYWIGQIHEHYKRKLAEQDKRARYAEAERDAFDERIGELETELETQSKREAALHVMLSNYGLPSEPKALAGAIDREREVNSSRIAELEAKLSEYERRERDFPAWLAAHDEYDVRRPLEQKHRDAVNALLEQCATLESERDGLNRETEAKATMIVNIVARCEELETKLTYATLLAKQTILQSALITDEMKALAVSIIG